MEYTRELNGPNSWYRKLLFQFKKAFVKKQKTYILPTSFGLVYGVLCFILLLMGMAYGNNLVYVVCFYSTVMGLAIAKLTNDHVDAILIESVYAKDIFAESNQKFLVVLKNESRQHLKEIEVRISRQKEIVKTDIKPSESKTIELSWSPTQRGEQKFPIVRVQSSYPAGLFGAWKVRKSSELVTVYPSRIGIKEFPNSSFIAQDSVGVLREIRDYKPGDSPKRIHWRSLAKNNQLRTLIHEGNEGQVCHLEWHHVSHLPQEERLQQLSLWISMAETQHIPWTVKLRGIEYISTEPLAFQRVMKELAVWKEAA